MFSEPVRLEFIFHSRRLSRARHFFVEIRSIDLLDGDILEFMETDGLLMCEPVFGIRIELGLMQFSDVYQWNLHSFETHAEKHIVRCVSRRTLTVGEDLLYGSSIENDPWATGGILVVVPVAVSLAENDGDILGEHEATNETQYSLNGDEGVVVDNQQILGILLISKEVIQDEECLVTMATNGIFLRHDESFIGIIRGFIQRVGE